MPAETIRITAEEINCLIYAYLQDSGFVHSAFAVRMEGRLERSPYLSRHIPRGELVELLSKSLLYMEVESHWRGDRMTTNCKTGFSLLEPHVCSVEPPPSPQLTPPSSTNLHGGEQDAMQLDKENATVADFSNKRKSPPAESEGPVEKRSRRDADIMDVDLSAQASKMKAEPPEKDRGQTMSSTNKATELPTSPSQVPKPKEDNAVRLLTGHKTEVNICSGGLAAHLKNLHPVSFSKVFVCSLNPAKPSLLASGSKDGSVYLWNVSDPSSQPQEDLSPLAVNIYTSTSQADLTCLNWNSDGTLLAVGSYDSILRICTSSGKLYFLHAQHQGPIFAAQFSKSGRWLLTASLDGSACLWDVEERQLHKQYKVHSDCCLDVAWVDDETFVTSGADKVLYVMRVGEDEPLKSFHGHMDEVNQVRCSPTGKRLASCSDDMTARVWNIENLSSAKDSIPGLKGAGPSIVLEGHRHSVSMVAWCPDPSLGSNPLIATSSFDGTTRLWDSITGQCLNVFTDHRKPVYALAFSPDGRFLTSGSGDGWLHLYNTLTKEKKWSWHSDTEKPGVFEIDWQVRDGINRIAVALECRKVAVIDASKLPLS